MQTGSFTYDDGSTYEGEFKDGKVHGHGTYVWPDGTTYTGDFVDGLPEGTGTITWPDGTSYMGKFVDGRLEGAGTIAWPDGSTRWPFAIVSRSRLVSHRPSWPAPFVWHVNGSPRKSQTHLRRETLNSVYRTHGRPHISIER